MNRKQDIVYVTYIYPIQFVVHENERIDFSIEEINNLDDKKTKIDYFLDDEEEPKTRRRRGKHF